VATSSSEEKVLNKLKPFVQHEKSVNRFTVCGIWKWTFKEQRWNRIEGTVP
jgi:hypothetical protein